MKPIFLLPVLSIVVLAACGGRGNERTCTWQPSDETFPLDLQDRAGVDLFILGVFVAFYIVVADAIVRRMFRRLPCDQPWLRSMATTFAACGAGASGPALFGLYFAAFEMIRIGNTHMSFRSERGPWNQRQNELLVGGIILFALVAAYRHARDRAESCESRDLPADPGRDGILWMRR